MHKMSPEQIVVQERECLQSTLPSPTHTRESQEPMEGAPRAHSWNSLNNKINNIVLGYDSKYKINIHEFNSNRNK